jgi:UDP-N-acetylglucosamine 2-epimerase (non-hydrolysing)
MKILHVVGARPNFMKAAPVIAALQGHTQVLVHTGQHYDEKMSEVFFRELGLPTPDVNLGVGSGSHATQTADVMTRFEPIVLREQPDWVLVYGDVNSTVAAALVCAKLQVRVAHVEAGLRSYDWAMPEEVNRVLTDRMANVLFTPSEDADANLRSEGIPWARIVRVGNVMIDTVVRLLPAARLRWPALAERLRVIRSAYAVVTLHRPSNVDDPARLARIVDGVNALSSKYRVVLPLHPRTAKCMRDAGLSFVRTVSVIDPLGYLDFLALQAEARCVVTDSGGIQEETSYLGVPCFTLRATTERPITVEAGTNRILGDDPAHLGRIHDHLIAWAPPTRPIALWDGLASTRISRALGALPTALAPPPPLE